MDDIDVFKETLRSRILQLLDRIEDETTTKEFIAFEVFSSIFSAFENELSHDDIKDAYPMAAWREDTVEIPRAVARQIYDGWLKYRISDTSITLGNAFNIEGGKESGSPVKKLNSTADKNIRRSNEVVIKKLQAEADKEEFKMDAIFSQVAEEETKRTGKKIGWSSIKQAYSKHGQKTEKAYRQKLREVSDPPT